MTVSRMPRFLPRSKEEAQAITNADLQRRVRNLERAAVRTPQRAYVTDGGTPLIDNITSSTAATISSSALTVNVPEDDALVLVMAQATVDVSSAASARVSLGLSEPTDIATTDKLSLADYQGVSTDDVEIIFSGYPFADLSAPTALSRSSRGPAPMNPYWRRIGGMPIVPTVGNRTYSLTYWRDSGTGTGRIWDFQFIVIVL